MVILPGSWNRLGMKQETRSPRLNVVAAVVALTTIGGGMVISLEMDHDAVRGAVERAGVWAPLIYVLVKITTYVFAPLSGTPVKLAAGVMFGLWWGSALTLLADTIGGSLNFAIGRKAGMPAIRLLTRSRNDERIESLAQRWGGWRRLLFARLFLSGAYDFISYAAGLTKMSYACYVLVTALGGIPPTVGLVALGAAVGADTRSGVLLYIGLGAAFAVVVAAERVVAARDRRSTPSQLPS